MEEEYEMRRPTYLENDKFGFLGERADIEYKIPVNRPVKIYCDGIFDLFHYGHARLFKQVKGLFPNVYLIVGVTNDESTRKYKGETIFNAKERYESVRHCGYVDKVIEGCPWIINEEFIDENGIDLVAHDVVPYKSAGQNDVYDFVKKQKRFIATQRTSCISTTGLLTRIIKNYEKFVKRNILRGVSRKDLGISVFKEKELLIADKLNSEFKEMKEEIGYALKYWEKTSKKFIKSFVSKFNNRNLVIDRLKEFVDNETVIEEKVE